MAGKARIAIKEARNGQSFLSLKTGNNKPIITSETYKSEQALKKAIVAIKKIVKGAVVEDQR